MPCGGRRDESHSVEDLRSAWSEGFRTFATCREAEEGSFFLGQTSIDDGGGHDQAVGGDQKLNESEIDKVSESDRTGDVNAKQN